MKQQFVLSVSHCISVHFKVLIYYEICINLSLKDSLNFNPMANFVLEFFNLLKNEVKKLVTSIFFISSTRMNAAENKRKAFLARI